MEAYAVGQEGGRIYVLADYLEQLFKVYPTKWFKNVGTTNNGFVLNHVMETSTHSKLSVYVAFVDSRKRMAVWMWSCCGSASTGWVFMGAC
jgi:hypothetical protein